MLERFHKGPSRAFGSQVLLRRNKLITEISLSFPKVKTWEENLKQWLVKMHALNIFMQIKI